MEEIVGRQVLEWCASHAADPAWQRAWSAVAFLGSADFFAIALPILFAFAPMRWALRLAIAFALSATTSEWLKAVIARPRPLPSDFGLTAALEDPGAYESLAFPSGHALMAVVLWGSIAWHTKSRPARTLCLLLIVAIAASRLALIRHDLLDVGGGLVLGALVLAIFVGAERAWGASLALLPRVERIGLWLLIAALLQTGAGLEVSAVVLGVGAGVGLGALGFAGLRRRTRAPSVPLAFLRAVMALGGVALVRLVAEPGGGMTPAALFAIYLATAVWVAGVVPALCGGVYEGRED